MANYTTLENLIRAKVYENGNNEITGQDLQDVLLQMVSEMGKSGMICLGVATTSTTPPVGSDSNIFYLAEGAGTYTNFGGLSVDVGEVALFIWNGSTWDKQSVNVVEIVDNLTTNDSTKALSAKQGKVLNDALQALRQILGSIDILDNVAGSAVGLLNPIAENAEFAFQKSGSKGDGAALINSIKGKTLAWNQFLTNGDFSDAAGWAPNGTTLAVSGGVGVMTALSAGVRSIYNTLRTPVVGHKYLLVYTLKADAPMSAGCGYGGDYVTTAWSVTTSWQKYSKILSANSTVPEVYVYGVWTDTSVKLYAKELQMIDLTLLGIDNLTTVEEVEAWLATNVGLRSYYPFNAGELKSNDAQSIVTVGRNQWDEEWELGIINVGNGNNQNSASQIRTKNYIPVKPNTEYYKKTPNPGFFWHFYYDANKNYIGYAGVNYNSTFTTPANTYYIRTYSEIGYGTTYNHDICINLSDAAFNGNYEPYWKSTLPLNIKTLTGKKDGQGASVTIFPDGAGGVGSVYDELRKSVAYKRFGIVDLGDLSWIYIAVDSMMVTNDLNGLAKAVTLCPSICSGFAASSVASSSLMPYESFAFQMAYIAVDVLALKIKTNVYSDAATFKTAMAGVKCIYQLATPETYVLDTPLKMTYRVAKGGTEERISPNVDGISAPMVEEVQYPMQTKGDAGCVISVQDGNPATINLILPIDATGAVFLSCGGATFSALVSAGEADLSISGIASGTYTFVAMFSGDEKYAPFSVSGTVTIS